jgi:hypothetical protein
MNLKKVGNIIEFENLRRKVTSPGIWRSSKDDLVLKLYDMYIKEPSNKKIFYDIYNILNYDIDKGIINPGNGLGFAILSESNLNVARWDKKYPIVLVNTLYEIKRSDKKISKFKKLNINEFGAFCMWELGIVAHEKEAWKKYLASQRNQLDKEEYLFDKIEGNL